MKTEDRITGIQMAILVSSALVGVGILTMPRDMTEGFNVDGWLAVFIGGILVIVITAVITRLIVIFPRLTVMEICERLLGKILGKLIIIPFLVYLFLVTGLVLRAFSAAIKLILLNQTPLEIIIVSFLVVSLLLVQHGINPLARLCEVFFPLVIFAFFILAIISLPLFKIEFLYSTLDEGILNMVKLLPQATASYLGFEIILFLAPFMIRPKSITKYAVLGIVTPWILYTLTVVIAIGVLGIESLNYLVYPTFTLARTIQFPGKFAERFDIFFLFFWVLATYTTIAIYYYITSLTLTRTLGMLNYKPFVYLLLPLLYIIAIYPENFIKTYEFLGFVSRYGFIYIVSLSIFLLGLSYIRKGVVKDV